MFAGHKGATRRKYRVFVEQGIEAGHRPELVGGGLVRSMGGWKIAKVLLKGQARIKGDERILGDSDFVQDALSQCNEHYERRYRLRAKGVDLKTLARGVADLYGLAAEQLFSPGRYPDLVPARSVLCYFAVRELGMTATELARQMGLTQPAISMSVKRGEGIVNEKRMDIEALLT